MVPEPDGRKKFRRQPKRPHLGVRDSTRLHGRHYSVKSFRIDYRFRRHRKLETITCRTKKNFDSSSKTGFMPRDRKSPPESFLRFYRPIFAFWHARLQGDRPSHRKNDGASCVFARPTIPTVSRGACWPPATEIYIWGNVTPHAADKDISGYRPPDVLYSIGLKFPSRKGMQKRSACKISIRAKWWPKRLGRSPVFIKTALFTSPT